MPEQIFEWDPEELQAQMLAATGAELERCAKPLVLRVEERRREGAFWVLKVAAQSRRGEVLDESLEAGKVWWPSCRKRIRSPCAIAWPRPLTLGATC